MTDRGLILCHCNQALPQVVGVLQVDGKVFVAVVAFILFAEEVEVVLRVVVKLVSIACIKGLAPGM